MYKTDFNRMAEKIKTFSQFGKLDGGGITRLSLSEDAIKARDEFKKRVTDLGMVFETDDVANMYATYYPSEESKKKKRLVIGSHCDSVKNGGNYDGIYGVLSGLEVAETVIKEKIPMEHPLTVMVWTNEEGVRFEPAMMSSGIVIGKKNFEKEKMFNIKATTGEDITFGEAVEQSGYQGDQKNRLNPNDYAAYFEPHIEQGPVLEDGGYQVGIVEGVVGMINYDLIFEGVSCHAGTFPQGKRKDAIKAASKAILTLWEELRDKGELPDDLVFTTGELEIRPNVHTVVPNFVKVAIDSRHRDMNVLEKVKSVIESLPKEIEGCSFRIEPHWGRDTIAFDSNLLKNMEDSAKELGMNYHKMYSGAGHDAQFVSEMMPSVMLFIPSKDGLSHTTVEYSTDEQCNDGATLALNTILKADKEIE